MKKLNLFFTFLLAITLFSCGSDDDAAGNLAITEANLIGKWQLTGEALNGLPFTLTTCELLQTMELTQDDEGNNIAKLTQSFSISDDDDDCQSSVGPDYIWSLESDNTLKISFTDDGPSIDSQTVAGLTAVSLVLQESEDNFSYTETYKKL